MLVANILLVLPLGALALLVIGPIAAVADVAGHRDILKRVVEDVHTASGSPPPVTDLVEQRADPAPNTITPVADLLMRSHETFGFVKSRSEDASESLQISASPGKRHAKTPVEFPQPVPDIWKRAGGSFKLVTGFLKRNNTPGHFEQPNLPEFIDTGACICGLLLDQSTIDNSNGEVIEMWRCSGWLDHDISKGSNGKWYNTTFPSQERSGINKGREWDGNPPYVGQTYVLTFQDGGASYQLLDAANSGALLGPDINCTGVKDPAASAAWYATQ